MKVIICFIAFLFLQNAAHSKCTISFLNQISARQESPKIYKALKSKRSLLSKKGYKYKSMNSAIMSDYLLEVNYAGPRRSRVNVALTHYSGRSKIFQIKRHKLSKTVKQIFRKLPRCRRG